MRKPASKTSTKIKVKITAAFMMISGLFGNTVLGLR